MKTVIIFIKRIIISLCILYAFNILTSKIGYYIPINFYTIFLVSALDISGLVLIIILSIL